MRIDAADNHRRVNSPWRFSLSLSILAQCLLFFSFFLVDPRRFFGTWRTVSASGALDRGASHAGNKSDAMIDSAPGRANHSPSLAVEHFSFFIDFHQECYLYYSLPLPLHNTIPSEREWNEERNGTGCEANSGDEETDGPTGSREDLEQTAAVARCPASLFVLGPR